MSAPQTNPEKQFRHHRTPIIAMVLILVLVVAGFLWWFGRETNDPEMPATTPVEQITESPVPSGPDATTTEPAPAPTQ